MLIQNGGVSHSKVVENFPNRERRSLYMFLSSQSTACNIYIKNQT
jgi:hypothetical protein